MPIIFLFSLMMGALIVTAHGLLTGKWHDTLKLLKRFAAYSVIGFAIIMVTYFLRVVR